MEKVNFFVTLFLLKKSVFLVVSEEKRIKEKKKIMKNFGKSSVR